MAIVVLMGLTGRLDATPLQGWIGRVWLGYEHVTYNQLLSAIDQTRKAEVIQLRSFGRLGTPYGVLRSLRESGSPPKVYGPSIGLEFGRAWPGFEFAGMRVELPAQLERGYSIDATFDDPARFPARTVSVCRDFSAWALPILIGARGSSGEAGRFPWTIGVFGGFGYARVSDAYQQRWHETGRDNSSDVVVSGTADYDGWGAAVVFALGRYWRAWSAVNLGAEAEARFFKIGSARAMHDVDRAHDGVPEILTGDKLKDVYGLDAPMDFGGLGVSGTVSLRF